MSPVVQAALGLCLLCMCQVGQAKPKRRLDSFISHYEELNYDTKPLHNEHLRVKRETLGYNRFFGDPLVVSFSTHGRYFRLNLKPHHHVFHPNTKFENGDGSRFDFDMSEFYSGKVAGEEDSTVAGTVANGKFHGVIASKGDRYHLEPARRYFDDPEFHSIVYKASDVEFDGENCGASPKIRNWMEAMQNSGERQLKEQEEKKLLKKEGVSTTAEETHHRQRRQADLRYVECRIKIAADHLFTGQIAKEEGISPAQDPTGVSAAAARVLGRYVMNVNLIYTTTKFVDTNGEAEGITFAITTVIVYRTADDISRQLNSGLAAQLIGVDRFLDLWSQQDLGEFCLAYLFTNRDFDNGVLGLAWVGSAGSAAGGVCDNYQRYSDGNQKTLNTGIVTTLNFNKQVAREVSYVTFAHELGHNMGSNHDPVGTCSPGGSNGNFIMYAHATSGNDPNNRKFSECSRSQISNVLNAKAFKPGCFEFVSNGQICGNGVVDGNETCDCGNEMQCNVNKQCCVPGMCTLEAGKQCGPQQGPCCHSTECTFVLANSTTNCTEPGECRIGLGRCNGAMAECEMPPFRPNGTVCNDGTATCYNGECLGSLCLAYGGNKSCFCEGSNERCQVCCYIDGSCQSLRSSRLNVTGIITEQQAGAPCDYYEGFCDFFGFCRRLDDQGPIARLRSALFSAETITNAIEWSKKYWWAVALMVVGLVIVMALIIHFLSKNTKKTVETKREKAVQARQGRSQGQGQGQGQGGVELNRRRG